MKYVKIIAAIMFLSGVTSIVSSVQAFTTEREMALVSITTQLR